MIVICLYVPAHAEATGWEGAHQVPTDLLDSSYPQVAIDQDGNAIVVWTQLVSNDHHQAYANRFVPGSGWGAPQNIQTQPVEGSYPIVAMDARGNAMAVWTTDDGLYSNYYEVGLGWGTPQGINGSMSSQNPDLTFDAHGDAIAIWTENIGGGVFNVKTNHFTVGSGWSEADMIQNGTGPSYGPQVCMDDDGNAMAVWYQDVGGGVFNIFSNRYVPGSGWGVAEKVQPGSNYSYGPSLGMDGTGSALVVWLQRDEGSDANVYACNYSQDGWGSAVMIQNGTHNSNFARLAVDREGVATAVWAQDVGNGNFNIFANRYERSTGWGAAKKVQAGYVNSYFPQVEMDARGDALIIWVQYGMTLFSCGYDKVKGWTEPMAIQSDLNLISTPELAMDDQGCAMLVFGGGYLDDRIHADYLSPEVKVTIHTPADGSTLNTSSVLVTGTTIPGADLVINGYVVKVYDDGSFSALIPLQEGENDITATATSPFDSNSTRVVITYEKPGIPELKDDGGDGGNGELALVIGSLGLVVAMIALALVIVWRKR